ncbi:cell division protein FtsZ [Candidatus Liberibacter americanus]|uniref:Cell division protein FtsZ n=1 Tax=Candidatus Liberibacter americanus str. Sao Paulo TaxID=1261131 RepID=U6B5G4_9HYPH|nr:cell division protein FtsZ [Candidatus Liberibacter americanus]AHA27963.1 Cell division protein FtsZ [Candidatus Liberibacter americanus str. Sao Paulo]EMS35861.1 cell division protein FtsZ [Candidatus Liberibacter americanus PW_SP]
MSVKSSKDITELRPRITVFGVGGGGGNAVNNMVSSGLEGVDFIVANTDAQALTMSKADKMIQLGIGVTEGLGAGSHPEVGRAAAEECVDEISSSLENVHMCFITAGMGGGTGTGAAPIIAGIAREKGILTVGVVTKPFHFEGSRRMRIAESGIESLQKTVDTLIVIPNQNLFRIANDKTTFADAFSMADQVLYSGVSCITDLMIKEGLINLDFADVRSVMRNMGRAMMGTGEASGPGRGMQAAEAAVANPLLDEASMKGSQGLLISITGGSDLTLFEVDEAATRIREEVDSDANIILGATFDEALEGVVRVSVVATGIDRHLHKDKEDNDIEDDLNIDHLQRSNIFGVSSQKTSVNILDTTDHFEDDKSNISENHLDEEYFIHRDIIPESSSPHYHISKVQTVGDLNKLKKPEESIGGIKALFKRIANSFGSREDIPASVKIDPSNKDANISSLKNENNDASPLKNYDINTNVNSKFNVNSEDDILEIPAFLRRQSN